MILRTIVAAVASVVGQGQGDDDCIQSYKDKVTMEALFFAESMCFLTYFLSQRYTQRKFWDFFMIVQVAFLLVITFKSVIYIAEHGSFAADVIQCAATTATKNHGVDNEFSLGMLQDAHLFQAQLTTCMADL